MLAARLVEARKRAGLKNGQVARRMGWAHATLSEIEKGRRAVTAAEVVLFADVYDVPILWLLLGVD